MGLAQKIYYQKNKNKPEFISRRVANNARHRAKPEVREKARLESAKWREVNRELHRANARKYSEKYRFSSPRRYANLRFSAKARKHELLLTKEQCDKLWVLPCYYCGLSEEKTSGGRIDRVDPTKGYSVENSVPCCKQCNYMKLDYSLEEFINKVKQIYEYKKL